MRESRARRRDGIMYHVGRLGEDGYTNRCITAWGVDGHGCNPKKWHRAKIGAFDWKHSL